MPDSRTLWTAVVIICIAVSVFFSVKKRTTFKRLQQLMAAKQWDEFDRLLDGKLTSMLYPRYNRDYLRLNSYLLREDTSAPMRCSICCWGSICPRCSASTW